MNDIIDIFEDLKKIKKSISSINLASKSTYDLLNNRIDIFIERFLYLPKQGSAEWLKMRTSTKDIKDIDIDNISFGGSNIAAVLEITGSFMKKREICAQLLGINIGVPKFTGNIACSWGTVFEDVAIELINSNYCTTVKADDLGGIETISNFRYSPDGLCVLKYAYNEYNELILISADDMDLDNIEEKIILLEIKCPYRRIPTSIVPKYYKPQPLMGLCATKEISSMALFVEFVFKICSMDQLNYKMEFHNSYHRTKYNKIGFNIIHFGVIGIYKRDGDIISLFTEKTENAKIVNNVKEIIDEQKNAKIVNNEQKNAENEINDEEVDDKQNNQKEINNDNDKEINNEENKNQEDGKQNIQKEINNDNDKEINNEENNTIIDFGKESKENIDALFDLLSSRMLKKHILINVEDEWPDIPDYKLVGYLPWKLFLVQTHNIFPDDQFEQNAIEKISNTIGELLIVKQADNPLDKFNELFP
jgi:hypothetical protein